MPEWPGVKTWEADEVADEVDLNNISDALQHLFDKINDLSSGVPGVNLIKNYPSLENADGSQPEWWEVSGDPTLTEEDASGEGIPQKNERVLKFEVSADGGDSDYLYMPLVNADEPLLDESISKLSVGVYVYTDDPGTVTLELYDNGGTTSLGTATTTVTGTWAWLEILNKTIGTTSLDIRVKHSANDATFYVAQPMANIGAVVNTWRPRGLVYKEKFSSNLISTSGNTNYADLDLSSYTSNLAVMALVSIFTSEVAAGSGLYLRRNGDTNTPLVNYGYAGAASQAVCLMDDGQIVEWAQYGAVNYDTCELRVLGYWEWES